MPTPVKDVLFQVTASAVTPIPIVFPTTLLPKVQTTNTTVPLAAGDNTVLAANANRKFAQIINNTGTIMYIAFGAAAATTSVPLPNGGIFTIDANTIGEINQQAVHVYSDGISTGPQVYEE